MVIDGVVVVVVVIRQHMGVGDGSMFMCRQVPQPCISHSLVNSIGK